MLAIVHKIHHDRPTTATFNWRDLGSMRLIRMTYGGKVYRYYLSKNADERETNNLVNRIKEDIDAQVLEQFSPKVREQIEYLEVVDGYMTVGLIGRGAYSIPLAEKLEYTILEMDVLLDLVLEDEDAKRNS